MLAAKAMRLPKWCHFRQLLTFEPRATELGESIEKWQISDFSALVPVASCASSEAHWYGGVDEAPISGGFRDPGSKDYSYGVTNFDFVTEKLELFRAPGIQHGGDSWVL